MKRGGGYKFHILVGTLYGQTPMKQGRFTVISNLGLAMYSLGTFIVCHTIYVCFMLGCEGSYSSTRLHLTRAEDTLGLETDASDRSQWKRKNSADLQCWVWLEGEEDQKNGTSVWRWDSSWQQYVWLGICLFHISIASKFHVVIIFLSWLDVTKLRRNLLESAARTKLKHLCSFQPVHFLTRSCLLQVRSIEQCARCYGLNWCTLVAIDILVVFSCSALLVCD